MKTFRLCEDRVEPVSWTYPIVCEAVPPKLDLRWPIKHTAPMQERVWIAHLFESGAERMTLYLPEGCEPSARHGLLLELAEVRERIRAARSVKPWPPSSSRAAWEFMHLLAMEKRLESELEAVGLTEPETRPGEGRR